MSIRICRFPKCCNQSLSCSYCEIHRDGFRVAETCKCCGRSIPRESCFRDFCGNSECKQVILSKHFKYDFCSKSNSSLSSRVKINDIEQFRINAIRVEYDYD